LIYLLVTCGWFFMQRRRSPAIIRSMQKGIDEIHDTFATPCPVVISSSLDEER
jgi:hypothetical protein